MARLIYGGVEATLLVKVYNLMRAGGQIDVKLSVKSYLYVSEQMSGGSAFARVIILNMECQCRC